ncbi:MAG: hypothetical protein K2Q09_06810 [Phycisphaerales bacterium]|nr:hypothetical protein [Phycisphaerales bacterium]
MDRKRRDEIEQAAADRLLRSADVLLTARGQSGEGEGVVDTWAGGGEREPGADRPFSYEELVEGMCFLIRCGIVEPVMSSGERSRSRRGGIGGR